MLNLQRHKTAHVEYTKRVGDDTEVTERYIIPTFVPNDVIKAIDVSMLSEEERVELEKQLAEYADYFHGAMKTVFSFEDWQAHTSGEESKSDVKWRTFKVDNLDVLDD